MTADQQEQFQQPGLIQREIPVSTMDSGPYYVLSPGLTLTGLKQTVKFFNAIRGCNAHKIDSDKDWLVASHMAQTEGVNPLTRRPVQNPFTGQVIEEHQSYAIPAQATLNALLSDRSLTNLGLTQIPSFDKVDAHEDVFNMLIEPERIEVGQHPKNPQWRKITQQPGGVIALRKIWLEAALENLETGRVLVDIDRVIEKNPYLLEIWREALRNTFIPSLESFETTANILLASFEESVRSGERKKYDPFSSQLMWLLGRKPERTALSRTIEGMNQTNKEGLSIEHIRPLVQEIVAATRPIEPPIQEQTQCGNCGERVNMITGIGGAPSHPPRKCRFCGNEFPQFPEVTSGESFSFDNEQYVKPILDEHIVDIEQLAKDMLNK